MATFSALEWKRFGRFLQSPYHNTNEQVIILYTYLKKAFPFKDLKMLEQQRIYKKVYGNTPFKLNNFQKCCSDLYRLATDFVVDVQLQKEQRQREKILIDALAERNYELFKGASQQLIKEIETQEYFLDGDDFLLLFQLNNELHHHLQTDTFNAQQIEFEVSSIYLNAFYEDYRLQFDAEIVGNKNFLNIKMGLASNKNYQLRNLFQEIIDLHKNKKLEQYFKLKKKLLQQWSFLKKRHKTNLVVHLLNFSFTNELIMKEFGYREAFNMYKLGVEDKLFIIGGKMRDVEFVNIAVIGLSLKEYDWTENFIRSHQLFRTRRIKVFSYSIYLCT